MKHQTEMQPTVQVETTTIVTEQLQSTEVSTLPDIKIAKGIIDYTKKLLPISK